MLLGSIDNAPKYDSRLTVAENELSVLSRQRLGRRIESMNELKRKLAAWEKRRNNRRAETR